MRRLTPDHVVLGLIEAQPRSHGYSLLKHFRSPECLGGIWKLNTSQLYAVLKRLEHQEWLAGTEEAAEGAPMRTVYWLTEQGHTAFYSWLTEPAPSASTRSIRTEFLSRLYLARLLNHPTDEIVGAQQMACRTNLERIGSQVAQAQSEIETLRLGLRQREMETVLAWLDTIG